MKILRFAHALSVVPVLLLAACSSAGSQEPTKTSEDAISSSDGAAYQLTFDAEVLAERDAPVKVAATAQLEYLQGLFTTASKANAQFRFTEITNATSAVEGEGDDAKTRWSYTATVSVVYPKDATVPAKITLALPLDVTKLSEFNDAYDGKCGKNEYGRETFWHDWNPSMTDCKLGDDVHQTEATAKKHPLATTDKYPEYDKMWADDVLEYVAVYGAISSTSDSDTGAREREQLITKVKDALTDGVRTDETESRRGIVKESKVEGKIKVGGVDKKVKLTAFFIDEAKSAGDVFTQRYGDATENADIILYSGHSGLGKNIAAIANATHAKAGQYQLVFLNGCQTLGYLGPKMHADHIQANGADKDPNGTKFLDVIVTTLPARSETTPTEQLLFDAVVAQKKGYTELLKDFSKQQFISHITAVFGEDDNTFKP